MKDRKMLEIAVFGLLILNILSMIYMQLEVSGLTDQKTPTAMAFGTTYVCLNHAPSDIDVGSCNFTMPWGVPINCTINSTEPDNDSVYYQAYFLTPGEPFNVSYSGNINATLAEDAIGNHTLRIAVTDLSGCNNNIYLEDFGLEVIDINHAPYLSTIIPNYSLRWQTTYAFFLGDYFTDIDGDNLTYIVSQYDNNTLINIVQSTGLTTIKGLECGTSRFYFIATDPEGLTATSNVITYTITNCPQEDDGSSGGGGGGGGGGGDYYSCTSDWRCSRWSACQENGTRQLRCIDYNGCNPNKYIQFFTENCTFISPDYACEEKWECTEWSICIDGSHTRKCIDKDSCGTTNTKPAENESCIPIPSCFNGIKDGDETGTDCGGSCGSCKVTEQPKTVSGLDSRIIIAAAITLAVLILIWMALRKQIKESAVKILALWKKKRQPIYLKEHQKQKLLNLLFKIQDGIDNKEQRNMNLSITQLIQLYFTELLGLEVPSTENIRLSINKLNNKQLGSILIDFNKRMNSLKKMSKEKLQETVDEIFNHIYLVSEFHDKDALILPKEREVNSENVVDRFQQKLSNLHIALEFKELVEAKNLYKGLLGDYNNLDHEQKLEVYDDMMVTYNIILYLERFY